MLAHWKAITARMSCLIHADELASYRWQQPFGPSEAPRPSMGTRGFVVKSVRRPGPSPSRAGRRRHISTQLALLQLTCLAFALVSVMLVVHLLAAPGKGSAPYPPPPGLK